MRNTLTLPIRAGTAMLAVSLSTLCLAQSTPPAPTRNVVTMTQVKPDMLNEWMDTQKELNAALKKAGVPRRTVLRPVFGNTYEFVSITPLESYAQRDNPNPLTKAIGPEAAARLFEKSRKCITGSRSYVGTSLPELSTPPDSPAPISTSSRVRVAPGKAQDYQNFIKNEILPLYKKAKAEGKVLGYSVSRRGFGASNSEFTVTTYYSKFADLDGGPMLTRMLGQEGVAKVFAKGTGLSTTIETVVRRRVADLS
ncbi:MAG: hypothetical protein HY236_01160 [Acidobacteria bacterium]|nr:hypothetical protein [Acidobacteriota bacterium]